MILIMMDILEKQWHYITNLFTKQQSFMTMRKPILPEISQNEKRRRRKQEKIKFFKERWAAFDPHDKVILSPQARVHITRYPWDEQLFCREVFQTNSECMKLGEYLVDFLVKADEQRVFGMERGTYLDGKKNGPYRQIFYSLYGNELPELFLWETTVNFRRSMRIEETGTYIKDKREGPYTIVYLYTNCLPFKVVCEEKGEYKSNKKYGSFRRCYYHSNSWTDNCCLRESGTFHNDGGSTSTLEKLNHEGKTIYEMTLQKSIYEDKHSYAHRTPQSRTRQKCKYTITDKNKYEYGTYSYSIRDIEYYIFMGGFIWRRGQFFHENRIAKHEHLLKSIGDKRCLPMEIEDYIGSFLKRDKNTQMGCFVEDRKKNALYTKKGYLSDDGKYIHVPNISDLFERKSQTLIFEKNLLWNSALFDNESFCLIDTFYIGCTFAHSKFYEPVYKISPCCQRPPVSVLRFLFDRKGFKGYIIFKNNNRNFISRENIQFLSAKEYERLEQPVTTLKLNPNFHSR